MNSSDLTSLIWLQNDDLLNLKHINASNATVTTSSGLTPKHFINVITSAGTSMAKPSILMFKPSLGQELTQLVTSAGPTVVHAGSHHVEEIKYIEMKDYNEDSFQSNSTGSSTLHSINLQVSPHHHSLSSPPTPSKTSPPPSSGCSSPDNGGAGGSVTSGTGSTASLVATSGGYKKPPFSYSQLVFMSIENSQEKALPLREIYSWIEKYFPYYKNAPTGWKNSIRHELSYKNYFKKVTTTTKFIKGAWSVDKVYRPKLYTKLKSFLNCDEKLNYNLNKCLCESVSKYELFSFINNNNDDEINAASIIMELKNTLPVTPGTKGESRTKEEGGATTKLPKQTKRKAEKISRNNNNHMTSNLNAPLIVTDSREFYSNNECISHIYEISPNKRMKVETNGELEGEETIVNIKIEDQSPERYDQFDSRFDVKFDTSRIEVKGETKEESCVEYDGTLVASEVVYQEEIVDEKYDGEERVKEDTYGPRAVPYGDIIRDPFSEIRDGYVEECGEETEEEERRKRDGAACALLHLAGFSSSMETKSNAVSKSKNTSKSTYRRKLKVLKSASSNSNSSSVVHSGSVKKNNSWTLLTYPELFACQSSNSSSSTVKTGDIER